METDLLRRNFFEFLGVSDCCLISIPTVFSEQLVEESRASIAPIQVVVLTPSLLCELMRRVDEGTVTVMTVEIPNHRQTITFHKAACRNGKRKAVLGGADPKRLKIWMGKRKVDESDSDDSSEDEANEENERSVALNKGNHSDSSKETEGSSVWVSGGKQDVDVSCGISSETGSEEEKEVVLLQNSESCGEDASAIDADVIAGSEVAQLEMLEHNGSKTEDPNEIVSRLLGVPVVGNGVGSEPIDEVDCSSNPKSEVHEETVVSNANIREPEKPLNFDDFNSSGEMEVLGLERLKSELQARGLKCGGTLQERAARLFLLKSTPLDKLPKKLHAKK